MAIHRSHGFLSAVAIGCSQRWCQRNRDSQAQLNAQPRTCGRCGCGHCGIYQLQNGAGGAHRPAAGLEPGGGCTPRSTRGHPSCTPVLVRAHPAQLVLTTAGPRGPVACGGHDHDQDPGGTQPALTNRKTRIGRHASRRTRTTQPNKAKRTRADLVPFGSCPIQCRPTQE